MKNVASYKDQVRTIFCDNCGGRVEELSLKHAEALAGMLKKEDRVINCPECGKVSLEAIYALDKIESLRASHRLVVEHMEKLMNEEIALLETKHLLAMKQLSEIKTRRVQSLVWQATNN